ncbi:MAG: hypothetical protein ABSA52_05700 [Candidatus Binatia bacterium]|jgi:hypothetical protein
MVVRDNDTRQGRAGQLKLDLGGDLRRQLSDHRFGSAVLEP